MGLKGSLVLLALLVASKFMSVDSDRQTPVGVRMCDSEDITCGVLYCTYDSVTRCNDIYLADPERGNRINLTRGRIRGGFDGPWEPVGSPDGRTVVMRLNSGDHSGVKMMHTTVYVLDMDGLTLRQVRQDFDCGHSFKWAKDSRSFIFTCKSSKPGRERQLVVVDRESLEAKIVSPNDKAVLERYVKVRSTSFDGKYVVHETGKQGSRQLWIESLQSAKRTKVDFSHDCGAGAWAPDRNLLAFWGEVGNEWLLMVVGPDGKNPRSFGKWSPKSGFMAPSWLKPPVVRVGPEAKPIILQVEDISMSESMDIDYGVLYCAADPGKDHNDLFLADPVLGIWKNLTGGRLLGEGGWSGPWGPVASPDGKTIVFFEYRVSGKKGGVKVWMLSMGDSRLRKVPLDAASDFEWAIDSNSFLARSGKRLVIVDRETLKTKTVSPLDEEVTKEYVEAGSTSADGQYGVYEDYHSVSGIPRLWIKSIVNGSKIRVNFEGACCCGRWAPDRNLLAFWGEVGNEWLLMIVGPDGKNPRSFGKSGPGGFMPPSWLKVQEPH